MADDLEATTRILPDVPGHSYGPSLFPSIIGWGFVASGILLAGAALRRGGALSGLIAFPDWRGSPRGLLQVALMVVAILVFIRFGDWLGFRLFAFATLALMYLAAGRGLLQAGAIAPIVLGKLVEQNLMQSLGSAQGDLLVFFQRPISAALAVATIAVWGVTLLRWAQRSLRAAEQRRE